MASNADRIRTAVTEAMQRVGDIQWNIADTPHAPPQLTDLDGLLVAIRMRIGWLEEIKEDQWNALWIPLADHAREILNAITDICSDLEKGCWTKDEYGQLSLRIEVYTSRWKWRRIFAHRMALCTWQHSLDLINGTAYW
jgi:hypothetical protein